jgi:hypothetical protein
LMIELRAVRRCRRPRRCSVFKGIRAGPVSGPSGWTPPPAGLQELLRPAVVQPFGDTFPSAELGNTGLATQAVQNDTDLLLSRIVLAGRPADVLHKTLGR